MFRKLCRNLNTAIVVLLLAIVVCVDVLWDILCLAGLCLLGIVILALCSAERAPTSAPDLPAQSERPSVSILEP